MRSGYILTFKEKLSGCGPSRDQLGRWWKCLWKLVIHLKIKVFMWKIFHNAFSSSENLVRRNIHIECGCKLCDCNFESSFYIFVQCPLVHVVWKKNGFVGKY